MKKRRLLFTIIIGLSLILSACTHLTQPKEIIGKSVSYLDCGTNPPTLREMARHEPSGKDNFEWWYFDGHLDTGETFVGVFHGQNYVMGKPVVTFSLYGKDWVREDHMLALKDGDMKVSDVDLQLTSSAGYIKRIDDKTVLVGWNLDGIKADFKLTTLSPGWMPSQAPNIPDEKKVFFWAVHQGRNNIDGTIVKDGVTRNVTGKGYADHNWGTKAIHEITPYWIWGRIFAGSYTFIYANVTHNNKEIPAVLPFYIAKGDKMLAGVNGATIRQMDFVTDPERQRFYPRYVDIDYADKGVEAHIKIHHKAVVENRDLLTASGLSPFTQWFFRTFISRPTYFRIIADYEGTIVENGATVPLKGECLYEIMGLR